MTGRAGILGVTVAVLVSSVALAAPGTRSYEGAVTQGAGSVVTFDVVKKESGKKKVRNAAFQGVPAFCEGSPAQIGGSVPGTVKVKKKRFKLESSDVDRTLSFRGAVKNRGRKAAGTLSFSGSFDVEGQAVSCATGPRGWTATRV
ncbi:MAG: hypothetical protein ACRDMA_12115 [Solirubrobacterales bacterium]